MASLQYCDVVAYFQQLIVDACAQIDRTQLCYLRLNQDDLRYDLYSGVVGAVLGDDD